MPDQRIKLLVINSSSASGSTLLDTLLGTQPGIQTLGEVGVLGRYVANDSACACGQPLSGCPVWSKLHAHAAKPRLNDELDQYLNTSSFIGRWFRYFYTVLFGHLHSFDPMVETYARETRNMLDNYIAVQEQETGEPVRWLVDATKSHWRLQWLHVSGLFDIRVIHLIKDPRAYVHSMDKVYADRKRGHPDATRSACKLAYRWVTANAAILIQHRMCWPQERRRVIRYDALAVNHQQTVHDICEWLDVPFDAERAAQFREHVSHAIGGNRMRAESRPVQVDTEWLSKLDPVRSWHVWIVAWPLAMLFGFRRRTSSDQRGRLGVR